MRFLIGILTGAILTLFFATAMDAPTHRFLEHTEGVVDRIWDRLISTTSDSLFIEDDATPDTDALLESLQQEKLQALKTTDELLPEHSAAIPAASQPATGLSAPQPIEEPPPAKALRLPVVAESTTEMDQDRHLDPIDQNEDSRSLSVATTQPALAFLENDASGQPIWEPFHSLMSAEGFAARLSQQLDHEFRVQRQGAGSYQVVFEAVDPAQRADLLTQIAEITGQ